MKKENYLILMCMVYLYNIFYGGVCYALAGVQGVLSGLIFMTIGMIIAVLMVWRKE